MSVSAFIHSYATVLSWSRFASYVCESPVHSSSRSQLPNQNSTHCNGRQPLSIQLAIWRLFSKNFSDSLRFLNAVQGSKQSVHSSRERSFSLQLLICRGATHEQTGMCWNLQSGSFGHFIRSKLSYASWKPGIVLARL